MAERSLAFGHKSIWPPICDRSGATPEQYVSRHSNSLFSARVLIRLIGMRFIFDPEKSTQQDPS